MLPKVSTITRIDCSHNFPRIKMEEKKEGIALERSVWDCEDVVRYLLLFLDPNAVGKVSMVSHFLQVS